MKLATNKELKDMFIMMNERFFGNSIDADTEVRFAIRLDDKEQLGNDCDGAYMRTEKLILIDASLRKYGRLVQCILIHEMIHADLPHHVSQPDTEDHGMLFHHKVVNLFHAGAYDGLLIFIVSVLLFVTKGIV